MRMPRRTAIALLSIACLQPYAALSTPVAGTSTGTTGILLQTLTAVIAWDPVTKTTDGRVIDIDAYRLYCGTVPGEYDRSVDIGTGSRATLDGMMYGTDYYFVVTAIANGKESIFSEEIAWTSPGDPNDAFIASTNTSPPVGQGSSDQNLESNDAAAVETRRTYKATIVWNPVTKATDGRAVTTDGYRLYRGTAPSQYDHSAYVDAKTSITIGDLEYDTNYYFTVTAVADGRESPYSEEITLILPSDTSDTSDALVASTKTAPAVGHWDFDQNLEFAGSALCTNPVPDISGNGNTMYGWDPIYGPSYSKVGATPSGTGLSIDANGSQDGYLDDEISLPTFNLNTWSPETWTIEASVLMNDLGGWRTFIGKDGSSLNRAESDFYLQKSGTIGDVRVSLATVSGQRIDLNTGYIPPLGQWFHLAVTSDGSTVSIYVNDGTGWSLKGTAALTGGSTAKNALANGKGGHWTFMRGWYGGNHVDRVDGRMDNVRFSAGALAPEEFLYNPPIAVAKLKAYAVSANTIRLNWSTGGSATEYNVRRSTSSGGPYTTIGSTSDTSFTDTGLVASMTYYYVVTAVNEKGESANSAEASAITSITVGQWNFDQNLAYAGTALSAHPVKDLSGNGNTMYGWDPIYGPSYSKVGATPSGAGLSLNANGGQDGYLDDDRSSPILDLNTWSPEAWTIEASVVMDDLGGYETFIGKDGTIHAQAESDFYLQKTGNPGDVRVSLSTVSGQRVNINTGFFPTVGKWFHLAVTSDGSKISIYVNDGKGWSLKGSAALTGGSSANNALANGNGANWTFMRGWFGGMQVNQVDGRMDNVRFSAGALDPKAFLYTADISLPSLLSPETQTALGDNISPDWSISWDAGTSVGTQPTPPATPADLNATAISISQIDLAWTASPGADSYNVKWAAESGGPYSTIGTGITTTKYSVPGAMAGSVNYYVVSAVNANGEGTDSTEAYAETPDLVAYLPFDETRGTIASDSSPNGFNGTLEKQPTWASGIYSNSVLLDGVDDFVSLPHGAVAHVDDFTIATWLYLTTNSVWSHVFDFGSGAETNMYLTPEGIAEVVRFAITTNGVAGEQEIVGTEPLPIFEWTHVAVTLTEETGILYINGTGVGTNSTMTLNPSEMGDTKLNFIGKSQTDDPNLAGAVDDFWIIGRALPPLDIMRLATLSAGNKTLPVFIEDISMDSASYNGEGQVAIATITVRDVLGSVVSNATVSAEWSGAASESTSITTDENGKAVFESSQIMSGESITFTVTDITVPGSVYNPEMNIETSDTMTTP